VAKEHRVSPGVVAALMLKARRSPEFLKEMLERAESVESLRQNIMKSVKISLDFGRIIDSAKAVSESISTDDRKPVTDTIVRSVMKTDLDMKYNKIKTVSLHSNSEKNLVLRQRWALEFLNQAKRKKVFINIDETWLGMSDLRRMKWQQPGTTNSIPKIEIAPRITMILGLDTLGNIYMALA
jgi:hypothetical protein